jgi:hypothetical protein
MLEREGIGLDIAGGADPRLDLALRVRVDVERDMAERGGRQRRIEQFLVGRIGELEEGQRAAVAEAEEAVAIGPLGAEQQILLTPS